MSSEIYRSTLDSLIKEKYSVEYVEKFAGGLDCSFVHNAIQVEAIRAAIRDFQATPKKAFWISSDWAPCHKLVKIRALQKRAVLFEHDVFGEEFTFALHEIDYFGSKYLALSEVKTGLKVHTVVKPKYKNDWIHNGKNGVKGIIAHKGEKVFLNAIKKQM